MKARSMRQPEPSAPTTFATLREHYGPRVIIPLDRVREDFFDGMSQEHLLRRISDGYTSPEVLSTSETTRIVDPCT